MSKGGDNKKPGIKELRILPPIAIGRLGSAPEPLDNYTVEDDPDRPLGYRRIKPAGTLIVGRDGEIKEIRTPEQIEFKQGGRIRPVAPFLELFALTDDDRLAPLTLDLLGRLNLSPKDIKWRVRVANRKIVRRTGSDNDLVAADTGWFSSHKKKQLEGHSENFISSKAFVSFGHAQFIKPNAAFPEIRLRFTPAEGLIYGPHIDEADPVIATERAIYDTKKGNWYDYGDESGQQPTFEQETLPPSLFAIKPPAPSWLFDNKAVSRGYFDDACDGFVDAELTLADGRVLSASARICAAPPDVVPDAMFVRSLADDLDQVIHGPKVKAEEADHVTRKRAEDIVRRAFETVRFMNVTVMNGNNFKGRSALSLNSMPEEEAADTERAIRPVMAPETVDTFAIMALHEQVYATLKGGAAPWFLRLLRRPQDVADFTDHGRRKMPALMCGADNSYLALTYRQIDTIRKATEESLYAKDALGEVEIEPLTPRNLTAQLHYEAAGNPISSRPVTSVANCCPGLEMDFRAIWRRMFKGLQLREFDNLVVEVDPRTCPPEAKDLKGHRLLQVRLPGSKKVIPFVTQIKGPASSDPEGQIVMTTDANPFGMAPLEWSNALAKILNKHQGKVVHCDFTAEKSEHHQPLIEDPPNYVSIDFEVRPFFDDNTSVISQALADAGELTQGLCSPWQNDYRECSCYYWASARPDYVNVEPGPSGLSTGDNWLQKERTGQYVPDDYSDSRLIHYDDLFLHWEKLLRFQIGGRDAPGENEGSS